MALIQCPKCGKRISSRAKKCPQCGYRKNKLPIIILIIVLLFAIIVVGGYLTIKKISEKKEAERQAQINDILSQVEKEYANSNFDEISNLYDQLEGINFDLGNRREVLEYDEKVYKDVLAYYNALKRLDDTLYGSGSLNSALASLKQPTETFDALTINSNSKYGQYISTIRNNPMYMVMNSQFVTGGNDTNYDYGLVRGGYDLVISTYTDELMKHKPPYVN